MSNLKLTTMKTNESLKRAKSEIKNFDFESLARQIMKGGQHYSVVVDDNGILYWDVDVDSKKRGNKSLYVIDCPYYSERIESKRELAALKRELKKMVVDCINSIPSSYWM